MSDIVERLKYCAEHGIMDASRAGMAAGYGEAAAEIEKLRAALDCFLEQSTPTQWRYSRERAEKLAKNILAAAALKETGDE